MNQLLEKDALSVKGAMFDWGSQPLHEESAVEGSDQDSNFSEIWLG